MTTKTPLDVSPKNTSSVALKTKNILHWTLKGIAALIMLQTLFFKFSGAEESIYIFSTLGMEPWGRYGTGIAELIASILLLTPKFSIWGAILAMGIMAGAILSHIAVLGIEVKEDHGQLFIYACIVFVACAVVILNNSKELKKMLPFQKS
jgi:uncharacterized membrane protein YphA (DoxX/SURF4 family)